MQCMMSADKKIEFAGSGWGPVADSEEPAATRIIDAHSHIDTALFPPGLENLEAVPERMITEMDAAGVDVAVLHSDHVH